MQYDLDALLSDDTPQEKQPETYEEWVEIHGEPVEVVETHNSFVTIEQAPAIDKPVVYADLIENSFFKTDKGKLQINDGVFAKLYMLYNDVVFSNGAFYTPDGMLSVGKVENEVLTSISDRLTVNIAQNTTKVVKALKMISHKDDFNFADKMIIPFANGDMTVSKKDKWVFLHDGKQPVPYRLPVDFIPFSTPRPTPHFDKWLRDLFGEQDILTLQEYLGYCFLPTTRGQKALLLIGEGGVGKSVISRILTSLFGSAVTAPDDTASFLADKFKTAELENQLVFYEDDLTDRLLEDAGKLKKLITNETSITADRKNEQPFKFMPYCRFILCGNAMLESANDKSDGFYRRLLPLSIKPKDPSRKIIPHFGEMVAQEAEGIAQWALMGLKRLIDNDWQFTISDKTTEYLNAYKELTDPMSTFMSDCIIPDPNEYITDNEMLQAYSVWCQKNAVKGMLGKAFKKWLFNNTDRFGLYRLSSNNILRDGKRYRGYKGGKIAQEYLKSPTILIK